MKRINIMQKLSNVVKKKNKKKGFTLIELVIVLAVLGIIGAIAIPNFTKVKNDSKVKSDYATARELKKITNIGIELDSIKDSNGDGTFDFDIEGSSVDNKGNTVDSELFNTINKPAVETEEGFTVKVVDNAVSEVTYKNKEENLLSPRK